jgi:hypothetical protein
MTLISILIPVWVLIPLLQRSGRPGGGGAQRSRDKGSTAGDEEAARGIAGEGAELGLGVGGRRPGVDDRLGNFHFVKNPGYSPPDKD